LITSTLAHAVPLIESGKMDTADVIKFKSWLMKYCLDMRMSGDSKMSVYKLTCNYDELGHVRILRKDLVYTYGTE
jgi:hypothetical protein